MTAVKLSRDWLLWQLADSGLPTGGFVASGGLEAAVQLGQVRSLTDVETFVQASVHSCANAILPFVAGAYFCDARSATEHENEHDKSDEWWVVEDADERYCWWSTDGGIGLKEKCPSASTTLEKKEDVSQILFQKYQALDDLYDASNVNGPLRRASRAQGMALLTVYEKCFAGLDDGIIVDDQKWTRIITDMKRAVRRGDMQGHAPICFGVLCRGMGIELSQSYRLFLFLLVRSILSAAVRLGVIGPYASQKLLASFHLLIDTTVTNAMTKEFSTDAESLSEEQYIQRLQKHTSQTAPLVDIWQGVHDRLFAKLFWT